MHSGLNRPKMGRLLKCTEKVLLRLKFNEEHDAVGPGIVISNLGAKKCQKHAKKHIFWPKIGEKNFEKCFYWFFHKIDIKSHIVIEFQIFPIYRLVYIIFNNF